MSEDLFDVQQVTLRFGGVVSLRDVSPAMRRGEILAVIGPERRGKDVAVQLHTGVYQPQEGTITFASSKAPPIIGQEDSPHRPGWRFEDFPGVSSVQRTHRL